MEHIVFGTVVDHVVLHYALCLMNTALRQLELITMLVRGLLYVLMLIGVATITYAIGQWIDGDNLLFDLSVKPFWIYQLRECNAC